MTTLRVCGEVGPATVDAFAQALDRALTTGNDLVVDVGELAFVDAAGLRLLARTDERLRREGRRLRVERPSRHLRRLLHVVGLDHVISGERP
ncbi:STAS domain-containing protein [Actinoplanes sp. CA-054009]